MRDISNGIIYAILISIAIFSAVVLAHGVNPAQHSQLQFSGAAIGSASIHAPAVILTNNSGVITRINLTITSGDGTVRIIGPKSVGSSTLQAAESAAQYASNYMGVNEKLYNFTYEIDDFNASVSGPSAGGAMTMLALSSFSGKPLLQNFTMTGTINPNGLIGPIGGVYDKMSAASALGLKFGLVPYASPGSFENELYLLIQENFQLPIIEISNVSQAFGYATGAMPVAGHNVTYKFYTKYNTSNIPYAKLQCSNSCNESRFESLANYTFNITNAVISSLPAKFVISKSNLSDALSQAELISSKGYYYTGADLGFLDYTNAYLMHSSNVTKPEALGKLYNTASYCGSLVPPPITQTNMEYVLGGELRQAWGNYTVDNLISNYNSTATDSDGVMENMYEDGISNAWCDSAAYMYGIASSIGGNASLASQALQPIAASRLSAASKYGDSYYYETAASAYSKGNYPLAILDADYASATPMASASFNISTSTLDSMAERLANSSTYGIWATQFANEALFYANQSAVAPNSSAAHTYAASAYSTAVLASLISNDTRIISNNLVSYPSSQSTASLSGFSQELSEIYGLMETIVILILIILIIVAVILGFILMLVYHVSKAGAAIVLGNGPAMGKRPKASRKTKR